MTTTVLGRGRLTWIAEASRLHTQSPDLAQAWRNQGLTVTAIIDPDQIGEALDSEATVWVWP